MLCCGDVSIYLRALVEYHRPTRDDLEWPLVELARLLRRRSQDPYQEVVADARLEICTDIIVRHRRSTHILRLQTQGKAQIHGCENPRCVGII